jgi:diadenosine tetraphosphatase ApaH/serine/threonine PP2A family protein phosphatase
MNVSNPKRLAVFSDIHGNLHALDAVLAAMDELKPDVQICLGDVVGYGAFPNECIDRLRELGIPTLAGNHDQAAVGLTPIRYFNEIAKSALEWTSAQLLPDNAAWLKDQPFRAEIDSFFFVHASPNNPAEWGYVLTFGDARQAFTKFPHRFGFIGHSHQPALIQLSGDELTCPEDINQPFRIRKGPRYLVNVGSVGQPRDRNPNACFVFVDMEEGLVTFHRVPYDIEAAQKAIRLVGLPEELAARLGYGW